MNKTTVPALVNKAEDTRNLPTKDGRALPGDRIS